ncbi:uncharacterized protein A4U43_C07F15400 [Asparagus officinalis]|uniref:Uncharacterized protein n=1 Tax=Asparagus officinalis TaxID=4686 RepID=A0A5P1EC86_ASPOF|nr:uncharacterized protein A4U43_C07F15400 [Asparagus officinalis]
MDLVEECSKSNLEEWEEEKNIEAVKKMEPFDVDREKINGEMGFEEDSEPNIPVQTTPSLKKHRSPSPEAAEGDAKRRKHHNHCHHHHRHHRHRHIMKDKEKIVEDGKVEGGVLDSNRMVEDGELVGNCKTWPLKNSCREVVENSR